jgi:hypothetical protein
MIFKSKIPPIKGRTMIRIILGIFFSLLSLYYAVDGLRILTSLSKYDGYTIKTAYTFIAADSILFLIFIILGSFLYYSGKTSRFLEKFILENSFIQIKSDSKISIEKLKKQYSVYKRISIQFSCPCCGNIMNVSSVHSGEKFDCLMCKHTFVAPYVSLNEISVRKIIAKAKRNGLIPNEISVE